MKIKFQASTLLIFLNYGCIATVLDTKIKSCRWNATTYGYASSKLKECHDFEQKHNVSVQSINKEDSLPA
jgi:hypothetical protein